eukprot:CAMPEP_0205958008 /NCGR_PEP_ID=MMETSP1459-20131121/47371_1 /ASSEMBLY_ACC=CAM_ASM_001120 /TAXON_ID=41880 /ORGANISM="Pycnococcus provasolii, Strain RCC931" /LENGTH=112 /DNA_ID=CAMNT_0053330519 /DNA_START=240 /DNA_END=578 /DNA_ORIENTATION=-
MIVVIGIALFLIIILGLYVNTEERELVNKENERTAMTSERLEKYNYYLSSGDEWYHQEKYYNAAFQYRLALEVFPRDPMALEKLIQAYDSNCFYDNRNCGKSEALMKSFNID